MTKIDYKFILMLLIDALYFSGTIVYIGIISDQNYLNYFQTFLVILSFCIITILGFILYILTGASIPNRNEGSGDE
ncbi:hypothetical protein [Lactococcus lactis]|uniref:hypothetical protein n=1 Tax=Lactococcus lactis TaxID=1358 RepID=UPI000518081A|nr:hypothetical protein [Lactococcus lactis]